MSLGNQRGNTMSEEHEQSLYLTNKSAQTHKHAPKHKISITKYSCDQYNCDVLPNYHFTVNWTAGKS